MSIELEYAIKRDIRNNPVIREVDERQRHELRRMLLLVALSVGMLLFSIWQQHRVFERRAAIETLRVLLAEEDVINRQLRLNLAALKRPQEIEQRARALGLRPPLLSETIMVDRVPAPPAPGGVLARNR
jgi:hypothetical protein